MMRYKFRNDGRDLLMVSIKPIFDTDTSLPREFLSPEFWEMNYLFSILVLKVRKRRSK